MLVSVATIASVCVLVVGMSKEIERYLSALLTCVTVPDNVSCCRRVFAENEGE